MVGAVAIIPARGGSKSIPVKNIKSLGGYPLIAYSIAAGLQSASLERVIVSTDDEAIAAVARDWGAEVPFLRPAELAQDDTTDLPVFQHALQWLEEHDGYRPETIVHLRPTSPFRKLSHIDWAVAMLADDERADAVRTVSEPSQNPFKMYLAGENGYLKPLLTGYGPEPYNMPRQKLPSTLWHNGYVDVARRSTILELNSMSGRRILPLVIEDEGRVDIDSPEDWLMAEQLLAGGHLQLESLGFSMRR